MKHTPSNIPAVRAILAVGLGPLAKAIGVSKQAVSQWQWRGVPADRVRAVVAATKGKVTAAELRPDVFGKPGT